MSAAADLPEWVAVLVGILVLIGATLTFVGCIGLARLSTFYFRVHAPTLGTSFGTLMILLGSAVYFSVTGQRPAVHEVLIFAFVSVTTPVTLMLLVRAALYRDRAANSGIVPRPADEDVVESERPGRDTGKQA